MPKSKPSIEELIVDSPMGIARVDEGLRPVHVSTLEDLARVARVRSLPVLHHKDASGGVVFEDTIVLGVQGGVLHRLDRKAGGR